MPQVRAIVRAVGLKCPRKVVALALRYNTPEARSYNGHPEFQALRRYGQSYLRRKQVSILKLARPKWPLSFHTTTATFNRLGEPDFDPDTGKWSEDGELWDLVQDLVDAGVLRPAHDKSGYYAYSWSTCDNDAVEVVEDSAGRVSRRRGANVLFQMCPKPEQDEETGKWKRPSMRLCRLHVADVYKKGSPIGKLWYVLVGEDGMESVHFTRLDLACPVRNRLRTFALVPGSGPGSRRARRMLDDMPVERYGPKGESSSVMYQAPGEGRTQIESRDKYRMNDRMTYLPENLVHYPNRFKSWAQWDLREAGVADRRLLVELVRAQSDGVRTLPTKDPGKVLQALRVSYKDEHGEWVHPDANHPANVFERHYHDELRRLARRLNVRPIYFGLK
ncbi:MAG: hypothetical protein H6707_18540 [Deltaproteobacteria bacterium]|nr:hypothetical protein [Deltaproteobacteria bacterium]